MGFRCLAQRPGAQDEPPWGQLLPRSFLQKLTHTTMERKTRRGARLRWWLLPELPAAPPGAHRRTSSSTTMVAAAGAPGSTPRGPAVERLHRLRWWLLLELPAAPPGGPPSNVFVKYDGGRCRSSRQHPQGPRCRTSSSTTMVAAAGGPGSIHGGPVSYPVPRNRERSLHTCAQDVQITRMATI
jgi:hypothetical protein